jgi:hypothetical protein
MNMLHTLAVPTVMEWQFPPPLRGELCADCCSGFCVVAEPAQQQMKATVPLSKVGW